MSPKTVEYGDFQTPLSLATDVCSLLVQKGFAPSCIVEPTCGSGTFISAALRAFPSATIRGYECNPVYVEAARESLSGNDSAAVKLSDFFLEDWDAEIPRLSGTLLVIGNPPWVTNATVGSLRGDNLPPKANVDGLRGIEALTGRANFDISEWMLRENLKWFRGRSGAIAVLCKTSVARKVLVHAWSGPLQISSASMYRIDTRSAFGVSVDACLLLVEMTSDSCTVECDVYESLESVTPSSRFGLRDGHLISDLEVYERLSFLCAPGLRGWRSGVKHDCSRVFEFSRTETGLANGLGERVSLGDDALYPLLKSSDVANRRAPRKQVLVPHRAMDESPEVLKELDPAAWRYLVAHSEALQSRRSSVYRNRPRFSIFGIGPYSFAPWKVAISGLYKKLEFMMVGPVNGRPVLFDDTCYFFPCDTEEECLQLFDLVSSELAQEFWSSLVFWDNKRPITARMLNMLDLSALAKSLDIGNSFVQRITERQRTAKPNPAQHSLCLDGPSSRR